MNKSVFIKNSKPLLYVFLPALLGLCIHKAFFYFFVPRAEEESFVYDISFLYGIFTFFSFCIILILMKIKQKNMDIVGYSFLIITSVKMVAAYLILRPVLHENLPKLEIQKISFFIIFSYFLAIETVVTIRILNNKL